MLLKKESIKSDKKIVKLEEKLTKIAKRRFPRHTIEINEMCVFVKNANGLYSLYLPFSYTNACLWEDIEFRLSKKIFQVCSNIEEIIYLKEFPNTLVLLKIKTGENIGYWIVINPLTFSEDLYDLHLAKARFENLTKIYFQEPTKAEVTPKKNRTFYYKKSIYADYYELKINDENYIVDKVGFITKEMHENTRRCYNTNEESISSMHQKAYEKKQTIKFFSDDKYKPINEQYTAIYFENDDGSISAINISKGISDKSLEDYGYNIVFEAPVKKITFLRRLIISKNAEFSDEIPEKVVVEIWGITHKNDEQEIITTILGQNYFNNGTTVIQYSINDSEYSF